MSTDTAESIRSQLQEAIRQHGANAIARASGASIHAIARAAGGLGVRRGTVALIREGLAQLEASAK